MWILLGDLSLSPPPSSKMPSTLNDEYLNMLLSIEDILWKKKIIYKRLRAKSWRHSPRKTPVLPYLGRNSMGSVSNDTTSFPQGPISTFPPSCHPFCRPTAESRPVVPGALPRKSTATTSQLVASATMTPSATSAGLKAGSGNAMDARPTLTSEQGSSIPGAIQALNIGRT